MAQGTREYIALGAARIDDNRFARRMVLLGVRMDEDQPGMRNVATNAAGRVLVTSLASTNGPSVTTSPRIEVAVVSAGCSARAATIALAAITSSAGRPWASRSFFVTVSVCPLDPWHRSRSRTEPSGSPFEWGLSCRTPLRRTGGCKIDSIDERATTVLLQPLRPGLASLDRWQRRW